MKRPQLTIIEGGLAGLDDLMAEFDANAPLALNADMHVKEPIETSNEINEAAQREFEDVTAPSETDEFIFKKGPFLVDLD